MDINLIVTTLIAGGLLLLSFLKLSNVIAVNKKANIYFGVFVFLWATFWLDEMILPQDYNPFKFYILALRFIQFLVPLTFFLSVQFYTNPNFSYSLKDIRFLILPLLFLILLSLNKYIQEDVFNVIYLSLILSNSLFYTVLSYIKIQKHQKNIELFSSDIESRDLRWLKYIIYSFLASALLIIFYNIIATAERLNIYINLCFLIIVYLVSFYSIRQKEIYPKGLNINETLDDNSFVSTSDDTERIKRMSDIELNKIMEDLLKLMDDEKPYLDSELNLLRLSERLSISSHQLSYVLNEGFGENFFYFINKYRVQKAKELLIDPKYDHLSMIAIGYDAGFNSKTSFNTTFKKMTLSTPTEYKKKCSKS
ncbi:AraC family transcriptional regulator [Myroides guanonis]|uniref:Transcriptional regulator, AraC family n=1 Tax=Myroides guanonis TaxID=1150112 RepID=A0A1I3KUV8_9FLAO|nr:helix-turn-helix domain-containing protein [Myroides guanonis]SFI76321.1 transcriptional regulator, AraC family [Myroides guanonis]